MSRVPPLSYTSEELFIFPSIRTALRETILSNMLND